MNDPTPDPALEHEPIPPHHAVVRAALSEVAPAPHDHRERSIAAALAVFDAHHSVPSLDAARSARMSRTRRWNMALAAAAAVVLLGIVGTGLMRGMSGNDEESASIMTVAGNESDAASGVMVPSEQPATGDQKATTDSLSGGEQIEGLVSRYSQYGPLKNDAAEAVIALVAPIRARYHELLADPGELSRLVRIGNDRARAVASATLDRVHAAIGLMPSV